LQRIRHPLKSATPLGVRISSPEILEKFREVIRNTKTPTHVGSVPSNFGSAAAGTPKAAQWRTVFTIQLPLALIVLFGILPPSASATEQLRSLQVDHTMQLVCAVLLACKRATTARRMHRFRMYLSKYIRELGVLFPGLEHESIHHMAFHIYDFLELFGPVHSWWCFPFERLIGQLQKLPTNHKFGKYKVSSPHTITHGQYRPT
jgi:hypothetical protein